jgi:hypothetical protein
MEPPAPRWETLSREVDSIKDSLNRATLAGVLDRETNHIASMQEEIDQLIREALMVYWLTTDSGEFPGDIGGLAN